MQIVMVAHHKSNVLGARLTTPAAQSPTPSQRTVAVSCSNPLAPPISSQVFIFIILVIYFYI